ncbi:MAG: hypothetical protein U9Q22_02265 [Candidatus Altiarchaeota archaeon]|nr:hypothetical protein [Candidatus Altiarchaeota archaeon]
MFNPRNNLYIILLVITSIILYALLVEEGLFTVDERSFLYLCMALSDRLSIDCSPYFSGFHSGSTMGIPLGFFIKDSKVYSIYALGFPLLSIPFYKIFGFYGLQICNMLLTILTTVAVFFISKRIWGDKNTAYISSTLYLFCTYSLFYAVSLWYHSLITFSFLLSMASVLFFNDRRWIPVFIVSSAVCIWTAYYMFVPILFLFLFFIYGLEKRGSKVSLSFFLFVILSISWAYNNYVYSASFTGYLGPVINAGHLGETNSFIDLFNRLTSNLIRMLHGFIAMFICRGCVPENLNTWAWCQKSILESSPFLITALPGFIYLFRKGIDARLKFIISSNLAYTLMILYGKTNTFGSWELSMRYLLPVIPLLVIFSSGFISRFLDYRLLYPLLIVSTLFSYFSPTLFFGFWYHHLSLLLIPLSLGLAAFMSLIWMCQRVGGNFHLDVNTKKFVTATLILSLILLSNYININDVKIGNEVRLCSKLLSEKTGKMEITDPFIFRDNIKKGPDEVVNITLSVYDLPLKYEARM